MTNSIYHIYDKVFKKILTLSSGAVVNLINGLFETSYPTDSIITYNWTEFESDELKKILADTILTINNTQSYHIEAQITEDEDIIFRVFEYSFGHADRNRIRMTSHKNTNASSNCTTEQEPDCELLFPEPKVIYLCPSGKAPAQYTMKLNFGTQGSFLYKVSTFKLLDISLDELNQRKMIILIPFQLLKLKDLLSKDRSEENLLALQNLIQHDILESIESNLTLGNITPDDARRLKRLTHKLYTHIYSHYEEMEALNELTDESLILDIDIIDNQHAAELALKDSIISEQGNMLSKKDSIISEQGNMLSEKDNIISEQGNMLSEKDRIISEKDDTISEKDAEIVALKEELAFFRSKV